MEVTKREEIKPDYSPPAIPELNEVAERFNRTTEGKTRAYMCDSGVPATM